MYTCAIGFELNNLPLHPHWDETIWKLQRDLARCRLGFRPSSAANKFLVIPPFFVDRGKVEGMYAILSAVGPIMKEPSYLASTEGLTLTEWSTGPVLTIPLEYRHFDKVMDFRARFKYHFYKPVDPTDYFDGKPKTTQSLVIGQFPKGTDHVAIQSRLAKKGWRRDSIPHVADLSELKILRKVRGQWGPITW